MKLVIVMSEKCGACQNFKKRMLPDLEEALKSDSRVDLVILDFPEMAFPNPEDFGYYHPGLKNGLVEFFPSMFLFPADLWEDPSSNLQGVAKHTMALNPQVDYSKSSVKAWIDENAELGSNAPKKLDVGKRVPTLGTYNRYHATRPAEKF